MLLQNPSAVKDADADVFSGLQAARRGTRNQRKYLSTSAFLRVLLLSGRIQGKVEFVGFCCCWFWCFNRDS